MSQIRKAYYIVKERNRAGDQINELKTSAIYKAPRIMLSQTLSCSVLSNGSHSLADLPCCKCFRSHHTRQQSSKPAFSQPQSQLPSRYLLLDGLLFPKLNMSQARIIISLRPDPLPLFPCLTATLEPLTHELQISTFCSVLSSLWLEQWLAHSRHFVNIC